MAGAVMMLTACGDEAVHTSAQAQTEDTGAPSDGAQADEGTSSDGAQADEGTSSDGAQVDEGASSDGVQKDKAAKDRMEMDEETENELTAELLEENGLDTSVLDFVHTTIGCTFDLPEGFVETEDMSGMYVTDRYPLDASTIYYVVMDQDTSLQLMTEESFRKQMEENLEQTYEQDVAVTVETFESIRIDGYPTFRIKCHYQIGNIKITQLQYAINADKSYMITYSQTSDYDRMDEYAASAATIHVQ